MLLLHIEERVVIVCGGEITNRSHFNSDLVLGHFQHLSICKGWIVFWSGNCFWNSFRNCWKVRSSCWAKRNKYAVIFCYYADKQITSDQVADRPPSIERDPLLGVIGDLLEGDLHHHHQLYGTTMYDRDSIHVLLMEKRIGLLLIWFVVGINDRTLS